MTRKIIPHPFTKENLANLDEAMEKVKCPDTSADVDAILRAHGYDPDEAAAKGRAIADRAFAEMRKKRRLGRLLGVLNYVKGWLYLQL